MSTALDDQLADFVGASTGPVTTSPHPVNAPMIRHWVEAMDDHNPVYVDEEAARAAGHDGVIAPATMLQAWIMRGLRASQAAAEQRGGSAMDEVMALLDEHGYTSVVATNCDQHYERSLVLGDELSVTSVIDSISGEKETGLGVGRFVTTRMEFSDATGALVATMLFRILKFRPRPKVEPSAPRMLRPRPALTQDNEFFFAGAKEGKLLIQRCMDCGVLRHPPRPTCARCQSYEWDTVVSTGRGVIYSFVVNHYPQVPAFDYPLIVALVELEEGTRLVANVDGFTPDTIAIGQAVEAEFVAFDDDLTLPVFRPVER